MKSTPVITLATALLCITYTTPALSQALPWQNGGQTAKSTGQSNHNYSNSAPAPKTVSEPGDQRTQDDDRLDALATKFYKDTPRDKNIIAELKSILKEVKAFHAELLNRSYNAVDIIRDTESLEHRVSRQLHELEAKAAATATESK